MPLPSPSRDPRAPGASVVEPEERSLEVERCLDLLIEWVALESRLTRMERIVLGRVARGDANKDISAAIGSMPRTVEVHVSSVLRKLSAPTRTALVVELWRTLAADLARMPKHLESAK